MDLIKVLHVEDDSTEAEIIRTALDQSSKFNEIEITHVLNLKDALRNIKDGTFDVVLLDLGLKELEGIDNVDAIREENPDLPVIVLTNTDDEATALNAIDHGAQEYLVKGHANGRTIKFAINSSIKRKRFERKLFHQANYDYLTSLPNRGLLQVHLDKTLNMSKRWSAQQAVMFLDINKFKLINDTHGHEAGNQILVELAKRLNTALRDTDIIARYGGDEFAVILDDHSEDKTKAAKFVARKMLDAVDKPFNIGNQINVKVGVNIGIAVFPEDGTTSSAILAAADTAMYRSKLSSSNSVCLFREEEPLTA